MEISRSTRSSADGEETPPRWLGKVATAMLANAEADLAVKRRRLAAGEETRASRHQALLERAQKAAMAATHHRRVALVARAVCALSNLRVATAEKVAMANLLLAARA